MVCTSVAALALAAPAAAVDFTVTSLADTPPNGCTPGDCTLREAVIAAVIEAEQIEPSDGDVLDALSEVAARENATPEQLREQLEKNGRLDELREDLAQRQAVDFLVEHATPVAAPDEPEPEAPAEED